MQIKNKLLNKIVSVSMAAVMLGGFGIVLPASVNDVGVTANAEENFTKILPSQSISTAEEFSLDEMYASSLTAGEKVYFKFKTPTQKGYIDFYSNNINISTHSWSYDRMVQFRIIDSLGQVFACNQLSEGKDTSRNIRLNPDSEYYIEVYNNWGEDSGNFKFKLSYTEDFGGDSMEDAEMIEFDKEISGSLDGISDFDYYKFTTSDLEQYTINMMNINIDTHSWATERMFFVQLRSQIDEILLDLRAVKNASKSESITLQPNTTYYLVVNEPWSSGTGNYKFKVSPVRTSITNTSVSFTKNHKYTGKEIKPAVKVSYAGVVLAENKDYTVKYSNTVNPGAGKIIITGIGRYEGTSENIFNIIRDADSVKLNKTSATVNVGKTVSLKATVSPSNTTNKSITWSSSNPAVATVSNGVVTAKSKGKVTITAKTNNGKTAKCIVTVNQPVTGLKLNKTSVSLNKGKTASLKVTVNPTNATDKSVTWSTSNKNVATVDSKGKVTAKGKGIATITVKSANGKKAICKVTVNTPPTSVKLNKTSATLKKGKSLTLKATVNPTKYVTSKKVTWSTSNKNIATVKNGKVTAKKAGTVTITVKTTNGKIAKCKITVKK